MKARLRPGLVMGNVVQYGDNIRDIKKMDIDVFKADIQKCIDHIHEDLTQIRTGRATPELVEEVMVNAYETMAPIKNYASISAVDAKTLSIQPWDKSILENISKAINIANMGLFPMIEGDRVLVKIPDLTEERRKEYVKLMKDRVEDGRIAVRQVRQKYMKEIEELQANGLSEDEADRTRDEIEKVVKETNQSIENIKEEKEKDLLTI
ncbi:MAG: Ribosome-recycling factor [candidate division WS6 bacterium GW2011_GWC2_36_7]|uniref:Ribosome-recycling factor n=1 Tax=candidate division WS6 bacterium GW2011_GWC2_36_7 TaxID=1619091 RepID=A0A0G0HI35_9BACT|nr:MAG: Ribosome-recycling factor [candidate division WS6 bacterium GW2011_GWC2_36_7]HAM37681.1 ribosome recycling factor [Patescibacteria group bacterium]HAM96580.1 ribosome recycling factor [Patescibacteria group bacterium]